MPPTKRSHLSRRPVAVLALAAGTLIAAGCGSVGFQDDAAGNTSNGKTLFTQKCGSCHVLADAGTTGTVGPDLDAAFFQFRRDSMGENPSDEDRARAESTIRQVVRGQIAFPITDTSTRAPGMPADIVEGQDAADVAAYVARVAGTGESANPAPSPGAGGGGGGGGEAAGKQVFAANCAGCHTLAAAGATGTVGPNLDQAKPNEALALDRVTNGLGGMPAFRGVISDEEIEQVAAYVAEVAGS